MLTYEHERSKEIVLRLVALGNSLRPVIVGVWTVIGGLVFLLGVGALFDSNLARLVGLILGLALGFSAGRLAAVLSASVVEWMAQLLVAQGEILAALKE